MRNRRKQKGFFGHILTDAIKVLSGAFVVIIVFIALLITLIGAVISGRHAAPQNLDVVALCEARAGISVSAYNACVASQDAAKTSLNEIWVGVPRDTRAWCAERMKEPKHEAAGYEALLACVKSGPDGVRDVVREDGYRFRLIG